MYNDHILSIDLKKLTATQLRLIFEVTGYLNVTFERVDWGEYDAEHHQHIYLVMSDDPHADDGRFIVTEVYLTLGPDGKFQVEFPGNPIGQTAERKSADVLYNVCLMEYLLPRSQRHKRPRMYFAISSTEPVV